MITEVEPLEDELRALFATVPAPQRWIVPAPAAADEVRHPRRPRGVWRVAVPRLALVAVVMGVAVAAVATRGRTTVPRIPQPSLPGSALAVAVLPAGADLTCTMAISALSDVHATGFLTFVHGAATFHPQSTTGNTYVAGLHRWVETTPQMVAPDGNSYVTATGGPTRSEIQVVDARGIRTVLSTTTSLTPLGFSPQGIVLLDTSPGTSGPDQSMPISLLNPGDGTVRSLPLPRYPGASLPDMMGGETGYQAGTSSVWMEASDFAGHRSIVSRYDLISGATTVWWDGAVDGAGVAQQVAETAAGAPIIQVAGADIQHIAPGQRTGITERTLLLTAPHQPTVLNQGVVGSPGVANNFSPLSAADGADVWLAADDGTLWRYQPGSGLRAMAAIRTTANGAPGVSISGPCR